MPSRFFTGEDRERSSAGDAQSRRRRRAAADDSTTDRRAAAPIEAPGVDAGHRLSSAIRRSCDRPLRPKSDRRGRACRHRSPRPPNHAAEPQANAASETARQPRPPQASRAPERTGAPATAAPDAATHQADEARRRAEVRAAGNRGDGVRAPAATDATCACACASAARRRSGRTGCAMPPWPAIRPRLSRLPRATPRAGVSSPTCTAAVAWYERAADLGLAPAQYRLGSIYEKGLGVPRDLAKAQDWYRRAADAGNVKAMHNLAVLYAEGAGGEPDLERAAVLFRQAAERGVRDSQFNLAILHARGLGVPQDLVEAYKWFAIAASSGDEESAKRRDIIAQALSRDRPRQGGGRGRRLPAAAAHRRGERGADAGRRLGRRATARPASEVKSDNDLVALVQKLLAENGYDPGPADGLLGHEDDRRDLRVPGQGGAAEDRPDRHGACRRVAEPLDLIASRGRDPAAGPRSPFDSAASAALIRCGAAVTKRIPTGAAGAALPPHRRTHGEHVPLSGHGRGGWIPFRHVRRRRRLSADAAPDLHRHPAGRRRRDRHAADRRLLHLRGDLLLAPPADRREDDGAPRRRRRRRLGARRLHLPRACAPSASSTSSSRSPTSFSSASSA